MPIFTALSEGEPLQAVALADSNSFTVTTTATASKIIDAQFVRIAIDAGTVWLKVGYSPTAVVLQDGSHMFVGPDSISMPWNPGWSVSAVSSADNGTVLCISAATDY